MVGMSEPEVGLGKTPPGDGKRGAMSGDSSVTDEDDTREMVRIMKDRKRC